MKNNVKIFRRKTFTVALVLSPFDKYFSNFFNSFSVVNGSAGRSPSLTILFSCGRR